MSSDSPLVRTSDRTVPEGTGDLLVLLVLSIVGTVSIVVFAPGRLLSLTVGLPLLLFAPGYVTTSALFPSRSIKPSLLKRTGDRYESIRGVERLVYSIGLSLGIVPVLGRVLVASRGGFSGPRLAGVVCAFVVTVGAFAILRRCRTSTEERFSVFEATEGGLSAVLGTSPDRATVAVVALGALFVVSSVSVAVAGPVDRGSYTELYLLSENGSGQLQATDYPREYTVGESQPLVVVVENHERSARNYTVVTQLQRVNEETGQVTVQQQVGQFSSYVPAGSTLRKTSHVRPELIGERLRLRYLLYDGAPPDKPSAETADQAVHLWVTVTEGTDTNQSSMDMRQQSR